jgi:hypothetical protein
MRDDLFDLWPDAPLHDADPGGRWLRFGANDGRVIYIQRYAWDDVTRPDFLVAWWDGDDPADQRRVGAFAEAVAAVRSLLNERSPALTGRSAA